MRGTGARVFRVLAVCTGNQCRSPAVEALLRRSLGAGFEVTSAGTQAPAGLPAHRLTAMALGRRGVFVEDHASRLLEPGSIEAADLVLTAERAHRVAVVSLVPWAVETTFTAPEFARCAAVAVRWGVMNPAELVAAAASIRSGVSAADPRGDEVPDPVDGGAAEHEAMVGTVQGLAVAIAGVLQAAATPPPVTDLRPGGRHAAV